MFKIGFSIVGLEIVLNLNYLYRFRIFRIRHKKRLWLRLGIKKIVVRVRIDGWVGGYSQ